MRGLDALRRAAAGGALLAGLSGCAALRVARHTDPLSPEQHVQLGALYQQQGLAREARAQFEAALRQDKRYIPAKMGLGNLLFEAGELTRAEAAYRRVLRMDRNHAGAHNNLAMILLQSTRRRDVAEAERHARAALLRPDDPLRVYALDTLAAVYIRQGNTVEARRALDEADVLAADKPASVREQLAKTRQKLGTSP